MNNLKKLFPQNLYHSYVIEGDPKTISMDLLNFLENNYEIIKQSPDVICQIYESFTINDGREIREWHSRLGVSKGKKICILATEYINHEAGQSLLKMIEEPAINSHFFIIVPDSSLLLDTILSRTHLVKIDKKDDLELHKFVNVFIKLSPKDRINKIAEIIKKNKDEENSGKLRSYATNFINELEIIFYKNFKNNIKDKNNKFVLEELQKMRKYLSIPGASVKMILEYLSLIV